MQIRIFNAHEALPKEWDDHAVHSVFLTSKLLTALRKSGPTNMLIIPIGFYKNDRLIAVGIAQYVRLDKVKTHGQSKRCFRSILLNQLSHFLAPGILFIGNNLLTGSHFFSSTENFTRDIKAHLLQQAALEVKRHLNQQQKSVALTLFKDFDSDIHKDYDSLFKNYYRFSTQPNMILSLRKHWTNLDDYVGDFQKKYRDQYKRARKKHQNIICREMNAEDLSRYSKPFHALYLQVVENASFNTFYLSENHFYELKNHLGDDFRLFAYFLEDEPVSFCSMIRNGKSLDTYFLGYDASLQKEYQLYLNMLYDMISFGIKEQFHEIVFSRTALEIKSSVGAEPKPMHGYIRHRNPLLQVVMPWLFKYLDPVPVWQQRHPFKNVNA